MANPSLPSGGILTLEQVARLLRGGEEGRARPCTPWPNGRRCRRSRSAVSRASAAGTSADGSNGSKTGGPRRLPAETANEQRAFGDGEEEDEAKEARPRKRRLRRRPDRQRRLDRHRRRPRRNCDGRGGRTRRRGRCGGRSRRLPPRLHLRREGAQGDPQGAGAPADRPCPLPRIRGLRGRHGGGLPGPGRRPAAAGGPRDLRPGRDARPRAPPARRGLPPRAEAEQARCGEDAGLRAGREGHRRDRTPLRGDRSLQVRPVDQWAGVLLRQEESDEVRGHCRADRRLAARGRDPRRTRRALAGAGAPGRPGDAAGRVPPLPQLHPRQRGHAEGRRLLAVPLPHLLQDVRRARRASAAASGPARRSSSPRPAEERSGNASPRSSTR